MLGCRTMTYEYQDLTTGETYEVEQPITAEAYTHRTPDGTWVSPTALVPQGSSAVRRLVSGGGGFRLAPGGSGWAAQGYAPPLGKRKLESMR